MANDRDSGGVGYKRPPKHSRFQPGQSGNPGGRIKDVRNFKTDLIAELNEEIQIRENGREQRISKQRAFIKALVAAAIKGDMRATNVLMSFCTRSLGGQTDEDSTGPSAEDVDIIEAFVARERKRQLSQNEGSESRKQKQKEESEKSNVKDN